MNGIRNTVSAVGEMAIELGTQVALQISAETATGSLRNFTDLEEKYADLNRQRLLLRALRYDSESEVQRCREKVTTSSYDLWVTEASDVDEEVNVLLTKYEEIQASNQFWLRSSLSSEMEQMIVAIKQLVKERGSMTLGLQKFSGDAVRDACGAFGDAEEKYKSLTDEHGAMDILIQDHSNDKHVQLPEDTHAILNSLNSPTPFLIKKSGLGLTEPPKDEAWHSVVYMELADNKLSELPLSPSSPELEVLMLQGNNDLTRIPNKFFDKMPLLSILNLSYTSVRELPDSLFELEQLRELHLKGCECFMKLSSKIGKLKNLEKLDLDGTQIIDLPKEIQELTNLQSLFLCFYEYHGRKGKQYTSSTIIPSEVISKLKGLKHLRIDVNPDDERWYENVQDILPEILGLEHLLTLSLYIPHLELLKAISDRTFQVDFRFIVGRHKQRIISSTPSTCEAKFKQSGCSLKFVNGDVVPNEIKRLVRHSKALFIERHRTIKNLSEFKMMNLEQLRVCMLAECREMQTVVDGRQSNKDNDIFSHLLYLYVSHMKSLKSIWEGPVPPRCFLGMLKSLVLQNCPKLTTVFTMDFLGNLSLLKELIVKDCPKLTTLISDGSFRHKIEVFLPKLRKMMLLHLPELITISNGCCIGPNLNKMAIYDCPKLQSLSKLELSSQNLKVIQGEIKWWDQLLWREEWGISQRPSRFDRIFSSVDNQVDIMTQIGIDGDDIDHDEDMMPLQTLFEHPKQNAELISRRTSPESGKISEDGYNWRKYGQKTEESKNTRHYYKCTYAGCPVKKKVQISEEYPRIIETVYKGQHTHTCPQYNRSLLGLQSIGETVSSEPLYPSYDKVEKNRRSLSEWTEVFDDDGYRWRKYDQEVVRGLPTLRKDEAEKTMMVPAVQFGNMDVPPEDGHTWRKYGQKEILGSNYPRDYYRCTHHKSYQCPARKQIQRLDNNPKIFAVTYRGSHTCHMSSTAPSSSVPSKLLISQQPHDITQISTTTSSQLSSSNSVSGSLSFGHPSLFASGSGSGVTPVGAEAGSAGPSTSSFGADYLVADMADAMFNSGEIQINEPLCEKVDKDRSYRHKDASSQWTEIEVFDNASNTDFASGPFWEDPIVKEPYDSNADSGSSVCCSESDLDSVTYSDVD